MKDWLNSNNKESKDQDQNLGSEFHDLMNEIENSIKHLRPPKSLQKDAPLREEAEKMPQMFKCDNQFYIRDD